MIFVQFPWFFSRYKKQIPRIQVTKNRKRFWWTAFTLERLQTIRTVIHDNQTSFGDMVPWRRIHGCFRGCTNNTLQWVV